MSKVKQAIVVRRDLRMRRSELSSLIAKAATKFFTDSDESEKADKLVITLSSDEASWLAESNPRFVVLGVPSSSALDNLLFRAEAEGLSVYRVTGVRNIDADDVKAGIEEQVLVAAIGPDSAEVIDQVTGKLKLF